MGYFWAATVYLFLGSLGWLVVIAVALVVFAVSRGFEVKEIPVPFFASVTLQKPITIRARKSAFWICVPIVIYGLYLTPLFHEHRYGLMKECCDIIEDLPDQAVELCIESRQTYAHHANPNSRVHSFVKELVLEYQQCARDIWRSNGGKFTKKYLDAVEYPENLPWTTAFVSWGMLQAGLTDQVEVTGNSNQLKNNLATSSLAISYNEVTPMPGDVVFLKSYSQRVTNSIFPSVVTVVDPIAGTVDIITGNNVNHRFRDDFDGDMTIIRQIDIKSDNVDSVFRFK